LYKYTKCKKNAIDSEVSEREDILKVFCFLACALRELQKKMKKRNIFMCVSMPEVVKKKRNIAFIHYLTATTNNDDSVFFFIQKQKNRGEKKDLYSHINIYNRKKRIEKCFKHVLKMNNLIPYQV
jgi:hypothetical protein